MTLSIRARVLKGVKVLNENRPGWHRQINFSMLDMRQCDTCILGQLYRSFVTGMFQLGASHHSGGYTNFKFAETHGFMAPEEILSSNWQRSEAASDRYYERLTKYWIDEITKLRAQDKQSKAAKKAWATRRKAAKA